MVGLARRCRWVGTLMVGVCVGLPGVHLRTGSLGAFAFLFVAFLTAFFVAFLAAVFVAFFVAFFFGLRGGGTGGDGGTVPSWAARVGQGRKPPPAAHPQR